MDLHVDSHENLYYPSDVPKEKSCDAEDKLFQCRLQRYEDQRKWQVEEDRLQNIIKMCQNYNDAQAVNKTKSYSLNEGQELLDALEVPDVLPHPTGSQSSYLASSPNADSSNEQSSSTTSPNYNIHSYSSHNDANYEALDALSTEKLLIRDEIDDIKRQHSSDAEDEELREFQKIEREIKLNELYRCLDNIEKQIGKVSQQCSSLLPIDGKDPKEAAPLATSETDYSSSRDSDLFPTTELEDQLGIRQGNSNRESPSTERSPSISKREESQSSPIVRLRKQRQESQERARPLTVYLPSPQNDLDLINHITNLGHDLQAFGHLVTLTGSTCSGYLWKQNFNTENQWRKRFFHFDRTTKVFVYFKTVDSYLKAKKPRSGVYFEDIQDVYVDHNRSQPDTRMSLPGSLRRRGHNRHVFVVATSKRNFHLSSFIPEVMRIWIDVIFTGAEGYVGYE